MNDKEYPPHILNIIRQAGFNSSGEFILYPTNESSFHFQLDQHEAFKRRFGWLRYVQLMITAAQVHPVNLTYSRIDDKWNCHMVLTPKIGQQGRDLIFATAFGMTAGYLHPLYAYFDADDRNAITEKILDGTTSGTEFEDDMCELFILADYLRMEGNMFFAPSDYTKTDVREEKPLMGYLDHIGESKQTGWRKIEFNSNAAQVVDKLSRLFPTKRGKRANMRRAFEHILAGGDGAIRQKQVGGLHGPTERELAEFNAKWSKRGRATMNQFASESGYSIATIKRWRKLVGGHRL